MGDYTGGFMAIGVLVLIGLFFAIFGGVKEPRKSRQRS